MSRPASIVQRVCSTNRGAQREGNRRLPDTFERLLISALHHRPPAEIVKSARFIPACERLQPANDSQSSFPARVTGFYPRGFPPSGNSNKWVKQGKCCVSSLSHNQPCGFNLIFPALPHLTFIRLNNSVSRTAIGTFSAAQRACFCCRVETWSLTTTQGYRGLVRPELLIPSE